MTLPVNTIICSDCLEVMPTFDNDVFDTIIIDPPYGLGFMGKEWDTFKQGYLQKHRKADQKHRPRTDGRTVPAWGNGADAGSYDFSRNREFQQWFTLWAKEALRVAKPGAIMLCFGGTRTYHRLTCAIEDAGWQIRDCIMWLYGSGFPKSHNISKAIDKTKGAERKIIGKREGTYADIRRDRDTGIAELHGGIAKNKPRIESTITVPATDLARLWGGWGTALKPAWEPIVVAMKPLDGTFAANAEKWGVAGLNIDGGRIGTESHIVHGKEAGKFQPCGGETKKDYHEVQGRFPANVILDEEAAAMLDEQSGERSAGHYSGKVPEGGGLYKLGLKPMPDRGYTETGGASRFFYCAKASRAERNAGLEGIEAVRRADRNKADGVGGDNPRNRTNTLKQNHHPTVKPLKLMEHLCELTKTPTGGVVLDCFGGSGTTGVACVNTGRDYVIIEKEPEYAEIARRRIEYAKEQNSGQMALFGANK